MVGGGPRLPPVQADRNSAVRNHSTSFPLYALLTSGFPGETKPTRCSLAVRRSLSLEAEAAARRLRSFAIFSARVRRRRISGRRLGADMEFSFGVQCRYSVTDLQRDTRSNHEPEYGRRRGLGP